MTGSTDPGNFIDGQTIFTEAQDLLRITILIHMYGPGSVAAFTAMLVAICLKRRYTHMDIIMPIAGKIFVTLQTGFAAYVCCPGCRFGHFDDAGPSFHHLTADHTADKKTQTDCDNQDFFYHSYSLPFFLGPKIETSIPPIPPSYNRPVDLSSFKKYPESRYILPVLIITPFQLFQHID
jgi:hypothetical protein